VQVVGAVVIVGAVALPVLRRRLRLRPATVLGGAALAPLSAAVIWPRSRSRDLAVCALQMYVYLAAYKMPNDDVAALEARVKLDYPIRLDRVLGLGELPTTRLQRALHDDGHFAGFEKALVWAHWVWFATPHAALAYVAARDGKRFVRAAVMTYTVFDLGVLAYWLAPTAPPWYALAQGRLGDGEADQPAPLVRRLMVEYGESFWQDGWAPLYSVLGGNPLAAMPSLHFATSAMAAVLLSETGPIAGAVGVNYAALLGFSLVYLGEHYVVDLLAGLALCALVRASEPIARRPLGAAGGLIRAARRLALEPGSR
jgi:membrane-associated phospholipid phosphatase